MDVNEFNLKSQKLKLLKEHNMITEEEFQKMKKKLIEDMYIESNLKK